MLNLYSATKGFANAFARISWFSNLVFPDKLQNPISFYISCVRGEIKYCSQSSIDKVEGNNQIGKADQYLEKPLRVYVKSFSVADFNTSHIPHPVQTVYYHKVKFEIESGSGSLSVSEPVEVNEEGYAETYWRLGDEENQSVKATLIDATRNVVIGGYVIFSAIAEDAPEEEHDDRAALIELYESTGGDNWKDRTNWCSDKPLNEWFGVKTNAAGRVIELDFMTGTLIGNGLTGNADFTKLTELEKINCSCNMLTSVNVTGLRKLIELHCMRNELTELNLGNLPALQDLNCEINQLPNLNVAGATNLISLSCYKNQLSTLDVSALKNLEQLDCTNNNFSILDVSGLYKLRDLWCDHNPIEIIYLHHMPEGYFSYESWGDQNYDLYQYPDYMNGYQYPRFIYQ